MDTNIHISNNINQTNHLSNVIKQNDLYFYYNNSNINDTQNVLTHHKDENEDTLIKYINIYPNEYINPYDLINNEQGYDQYEQNEQNEENKKNIIEQPMLGGLNKKYPDIMTGYFFDLDYIQKLIEIYAGTNASVDVQELNEDQLNAQCGLKLIKEEIMILQENFNLKINNTEYEYIQQIEQEEQKLKNACIKNAIHIFLNPNYIYLIFFILSKIKYEYLFDSNTNNLRNLSALVDKIHIVLLQFVEFLQSNIIPSLYFKYIPNILHIFQFFDISQSFHIARYAFPFFMQTKQNEKQVHNKNKNDNNKNDNNKNDNNKNENNKNENNKNENNKNENNKNENNKNENNNNNNKNNNNNDTSVVKKDITSTIKAVHADASPEEEGNLNILKETKPKSDNHDNINCENVIGERSCNTTHDEMVKPLKKYDDPNFHHVNEILWKMFLMPIVDKYLKEEELNGININFYLTYWRLSISDIYVPHKQYQKVLDKYENYIKKLEKYYEENKKNDEYKWIPKQIKKLNIKKNNLKNEYEYHINHTKQIKQYLAHIVDHWVDPQKVSLNTFVAFIKCLIAPRILNSEKDSLFCSKFIQILLELHTPLFNLCTLVYIFTKMLMPLINACTEKEALNIGIFFNDFFSYIYLLCEDIKYFQNVSNKNPCFSYTLNFQSKDTITHNNIIQKVMKWEKTILSLLFENNNFEKSWINSKSVVIFLFRFLNTFPYSHKIKNSIKTYLENLQNFANNQGWKDIVISINSLKTMMEKNRKSCVGEKKDVPVKSQETKQSTSRTSVHNVNADVNVTMNPFNNSTPVHIPSNPPFAPMPKNIYNPSK
ncbi:hypothetical protein PFNF54_04013 [Plasmodium falciparum NF54]|uniref:THO complex subunitTHOC2 C-terminal domain-containing protein n=1 Tax=Plasmodium falciparum (isolate NF54) TaxID=5843 RepID=W7KC94_PLAFO|nr:hypothetical protein PFNF54_04013 [Plasmodium falciparum NF54]